MQHWCSNNSSSGSLRRKIETYYGTVKNGETDTYTFTHLWLYNADFDAWYIGGFTYLTKKTVGCGGNFAI
jgi:hypothetical protein